MLRESQPSWGCDAFMIEDFPLKEWFCVGVVVKDREIDLFFNGDLTYTGSLRGPPKEEDTNQVKIAGYRRSFGNWIQWLGRII